MPFREKTAWLTLICMLASYAVYFTWVAHAGERPLLALILVFGGVTLAQVIAVIAGSIVLATLSRTDARAPADERDRSIARRGAGTAYYILMVGVVLFGVVMPFSKSPWQIINAALFALVAAETVRHVLIVLSYRRGWHG